MARPMENRILVTQVVQTARRYGCSGWCQ